MMERVTTITAKQFIDQDYDDIVFDNQAVVTFGDLEVIDITPRTDEFVMLYVYSERIGFDKVKVSKGEVLGVRWLDTAQTERDAEAYAEFEAGYQAAEGGDIWTYLADHAVELGKSIVALKAKHESELASLQAERDQLASQLVAAGEKAALWPSGMTEIEEWAWDSQGEFAPVTEEYSPNWTRGYKKILAVIEEVKEARKAAALQAIPQPAPAVDGGQVGKYVVCHECDGTGKLFVPETPPAVLPELDSDGQPAPANSELVAAVKQFTFMTALRRLENGMDTLHVSSQFANSEWIEAFQHMHKCMEDAAAALKGE